MFMRGLDKAARFVFRYYKTTGKNSRRRRRRGRAVA
jgi:hypothetical protein